MARVSPQEYAEKWGRRLKGSTEDIRRGVSRVTEAPGVAAAKAADRYASGVADAVTSGRWQQRVGAVSTEEWKTKTIQKGVARIGQGVDSAMVSQADMATKLLADVDAAASKANAMPKGTIEDSIARMSTFAREMHQRSRSR